MSEYDSSEVWKKQAIDRAHIKYPCRNHPLITGIADGDFSEGEIKAICSQIFHVVRNFPRFLSAIATNMESTSDRMPIVENLFEEHGRMNEKHIHLNTYVDFCSTLGLTREQMEQTEPIEGVTVYIRSVIDLCLHYPVQEGLSALGIIEEIVHLVSPIIGSAAFKLRPDLKRISHFAEHEVLDDQHSKEFYDLINVSDDENKRLVQRGLYMGSYLHYRLYTDILDRVKSPSAEYPLDDGDTADERLGILNKLYNSGSLEFLMKHVNSNTRSILEVGCGSGELAAMLAENLDGCQFVAIDQGVKNIELAQRQYSHLSIDFRHQSWQQLENEKFDLIYLRWVAIYQSDLKAMVNKLASHLSDRGVLIIEDNNPEDSGVSCTPTSKYVDIWKSLWSEQTKSISGFSNLKEVIDQASSDHGLSKWNERSFQAELEGEDKSYLKLSVVAATSHLLKSGFGKEALGALVSGLEELAASPARIPFVRNFQVSYSVEKQ